LFGISNIFHFNFLKKATILSVGKETIDVQKVYTYKMYIDTKIGKTSSW